VGLSCHVLERLEVRSVVSAVTHTYLRYILQRSKMLDKTISRIITYTMTALTNEANYFIKAFIFMICSLNPVPGRLNGPYTQSKYGISSRLGNRQVSAACTDYTHSMYMNSPVRCIGFPLLPKGQAGNAFDPAC
jgi:hypothetical protein